MSNLALTSRPVDDLVQEFPVDAEMVVEVGDLMYLATDDARPAGQQADAGSEALNQVAFAAAFIGIAASAHRAIDPAGYVRVRRAMLVEYPCTSATFEIGDLVGADEASSGDALEDQSVKKVTDLDAAIGIVMVRYAAATTRVWVLIESTLTGSLARRLRGTNGLDSDQILADDVSLTLGTGEDAKLLWSTGDASNHAAVLALGASHALHVTDVAAAGTDWNVSADTHPTIYVHSDTTPATDYLAIGAHTGSAADINLVGGATLNFKIDGTAEALLTASIFDLASTNLQMQSAGKILDDNGNELIIFPSAVSSAVNEITISNAATGNNATLTASGETNTGIDIISKGTGFVGLKADDTFAVRAQKDTVVKLGFYGETPVARPAGWAITNFSEDKEFAGDSTTAADAVKAIASLVNDLVDLGLIDGTVSA